MAQRHAEQYDRAGQELRSMKAGAEVTFSPQVFNFLLDYCPDHFNHLEPIMRRLGVDSFAQLREYSVARLVSVGFPRESLSVLEQAIMGYNADEKNKGKEQIILGGVSLPQQNGDDTHLYRLEGWRRVVRLKTYEIKDKRDDPYTLEVNGIELTGNKETARPIAGSRKRAKLTVTELRTLFTAYRDGLDPRHIATSLRVTECCVRTYLRTVDIIPTRERAMVIRRRLQEAEKYAR